MKPTNQNDGWITGRIYFNRGDKRIIVKRPRSGLGYTMNFGNVWTWILHAAVILIIVVICNLF